MSKFLTDLNVRLISDEPGRWVLTSPLIYQSDKAGLALTVGAGFDTDFGSVPRLPLAYMLCGGVGDKAAVIHDYLYRYAIVSRDLCDAIFKEALIVCGVGRLRASLMYGAVRAFGWRFYGDGKNEQ